MSRSLLLLAALSACGAELSRGAVPAASVSFADEGGATDALRGSEAIAPVVIRTATIGVAVDAYEPMRDELVQWLGANGGRIGDETLTRSDGRASWATLEVRLPTRDLDALIAWLQAEHAVERLEVRSQDVTAEWVDLDARLGAMRATEARLLGLLAERTASLADVLAAETELSRVRGDIESLEGRRRVIADQAELATVRIDVAVRTPYASAVGLPLGTEVGRAFVGSVEAMGAVARGLVIVGAAAAPWLGLGGVGLVVAVRRAVRPRPLRA